MTMLHIPIHLNHTLTLFYSPLLYLVIFIHKQLCLESISCSTMSLHKHPDIPRWHNRNQTMLCQPEAKVRSLSNDIAMVLQSHPEYKIHNKSTNYNIFQPATYPTFYCTMKIYDLSTIFNTHHIFSEILCKIRM